MNIKLTSRNTSVRDSFKESLDKKLSKLDRFFDDNATAAVTIIHESGRETVEVTIKSGGMFYRAEKTTSDRLDSLDAVVDALFRQIVKSKSKLEKRLRQTAFESGYDDDFIGAPHTYNVVKSKRFQVNPMDVEEAILQMNLIGHEFYMFRNMSDNEVNLVYKRKEGGYGLIEATTK